MLDAELQIVTSQVVDVSENAEQLSTAGGSVENVNLLTLGRRGFPDGATFVIAIEAVSAETGVDPVSFVLQHAPDGTNYTDLATIKLWGDTALAKKGVFSVNIGLTDSRQEVRGVSDLKVRVAVRYTDASGTDDFTYSAYIGNRNPYPQTNV